MAMMLSLPFGDVLEHSFATLDINFTSLPTSTNNYSLLQGFAQWQRNNDEKGFVRIARW